MYLKLWSKPDPARFHEASSHWIRIAGYPVYRLPDETTAPRAVGLLLGLVEEIRPQLANKNPKAVYIGTARGEIETLFDGVEAYRKGAPISPRLSPDTSMGSLASLIARHLGIHGPAVTVSQTCLSGLLALQEAIRFLKAEGGESVVFGAVEAPLHPFFIEAMSALRIYTREIGFPFVQPGNIFRKNTFALGEAIALGIVSHLPISSFRILALRVATAPPQPDVAFSAVDTQALERLLTDLEATPDFVILHAPGTRQGDFAEWMAIQKVWGKVPVFSPKAFVGHSLGAAPLVGLSTALYVMEQKVWWKIPYDTLWPQTSPSRWKEAVIIGLGYGGVMGAVRLLHET